ncbi:ankyrin repeat protein, putative, partial [Bodo saltans]
MASYFDQTIQSIQHQRWHGQCSEQSLAAFQSTGYHSCLLRVDGKRTEAVKLCALRNLRSVDERLSPEELSQWEGAHPAGVLHVGRTPVMTAIWVDAFDGLHELRNAGASFTMRCPQDDDFTALHYAVKLHRVDMIRYILPLLPRPQL